MKKRQELNRFTLTLGAILFLLSAFSFFQEGRYLVMSIVLIISGLNYLALRVLVSNQRKMEAGVNVLNAIAAGFTAYDYWQNGTDFIHWVWTLTTVAFLAMAIFLFSKKESTIRPF